MRVAVIGGGLAGLTAAFDLKRGGADVMVLEAEELGGKISSFVTPTGNVFDIGPNTVLESNPATTALIDDLGLRDRVLYADDASKIRWTWQDGKLERLPEMMNALSSNVLSNEGKRRAWLEAFVPRGSGEESLADFVTRRFGREVIERMVDPFLIGTYAARPEDLSSQAALRMLYDLEKAHGSVIRGVLKMLKSGRPPPSPGKMFTFPGGFAEMIGALRDRLEGNVIENARAVKIELDTVGAQHAAPLQRPSSVRVRHEHQNTEHQLEVDAVVIATTPLETAHLIPEESALHQQLSSLKSAPVAQVFLEFNRDQVPSPSGFGVLVPSTENRRILGAVFNSSIFPARYSSTILSVFIGGSRQPELLNGGDADLERIALEELQVMLGIEAKPTSSLVRRWSHGIPMYGLGYGVVLEAARAFEEHHPRVAFVGNWRAGVGVPDTIKQARDVAAQLLKTLEVAHA
jgi:protoporphyrinogen/coproporphyrinogen III oxidase